MPELQACLRDEVAVFTHTGECFFFRAPVCVVVNCAQVYYAATIGSVGSMCKLRADAVSAVRVSGDHFRCFGSSQTDSPERVNAASFVESVSHLAPALTLSCVKT